MSAPRRSLASLLASHVDAPYDPEHREFIERIASALYAQHAAFCQWPESVRHFYACYDLIHQILNGGWSQIVCNVPELIPVGKQAFESLGCPEAADLCRRAYSMLPPELVAHLEQGGSGTYGFDEVLDRFDFSRFDELDKQTPSEFHADDKLQKLVERHRSDFQSADQLS